MSGSVWKGVGLIVAAVLLFVLATMLSLADTGDRTNWYMWVALAGSAAALIGGIVVLVKGRSGRSG